MGTDISVDVALVHYPVLNRNRETIGSAVTNLDLHDIARAGKTFGVGTYWVVTPDSRQQELARSIVSHWTEGYGGSVNPDRAAALSLITIRPDLDAVLTALGKRSGKVPLVVATSAEDQGKSITYAGLQDRIYRETPVLLVFGTAWGLAPEIMTQVDRFLPPITGPDAYNHLSVRSAASIVLDRLLGNRG